MLRPGAPRTGCYHLHRHPCMLLVARGAKLEYCPSLHESSYQRSFSSSDVYKERDI
jgi:hypothetical protein